ncbi:MAG: sulfatase [Cytophagaceae bacterium]|nr:sulfatase [Cytophagaceae bacterium]
MQRVPTALRAKAKVLFSCILPGFLFAASSWLWVKTHRLPTESRASNDTELPLPVRARQPYNVLFIAVDDLRPELGCYGSRHIFSPNIDGLAKQSLLFNRAYCQQAVCSPSRTSLLTGLRPDATRVYDLQTHFRNTIPGVVTLPQYFKQAGYHTASIGKIYHGGLDDLPSWSEPSWEPAGEAARGYLLRDNITAAAGNQGRGPATEAADLPDSLYQDARIASRAIQTLQRLNGRPFFLAVGFYKPHLPFVAPKKYWDKYDAAKIQIPAFATYPKEAPALATSPSGELRAYTDMPQKGPFSEEQKRHLIHGYYASVSFMDAQLGRVLDELKRLGLDQNTIIVLWGDHGWKLGDYGQFCKHTNYEVDTHAPLLLRAPDQKAAGKQTPALVEFVDVYPSLCELAGLPLPGHLQGKSVVPLFNNPARKWKEAAFSQYPRQNGKFMGYSVRTDRYRFTRWQKMAGEVVALELYDHQKDTQETVNVANAPGYEKVVKELTELLGRMSTH